MSDSRIRRLWDAYPAIFLACHRQHVREDEAGKAITEHQAGLRKIRLHDLRHTFGSLLIQNGASIVYVKEQMGHSSIQVTVDIYGHLIPGANVSFVDRLDNASGQAEKSSSRQNATQAHCPKESTARFPWNLLI
jgi:integrase